MKRISDEKFVKEQCNPDQVFGIRIKKGEIYFLAWMEDAPNYKIKQAMCSDGWLLDRDTLIISGDIYACVETSKEYNNMYILWNTDDNGRLLDKGDEEFVNAHDKFLSLINCYERDGNSDPNDHEILSLTTDELSYICDVLRDGDYVFIVEDI